MRFDVLTAVCILGYVDVYSDRNSYSICSAVIPFNLYQTTWHHIQEDDDLYTVGSCK